MKPGEVYKRITMVTKKAKPQPSPAKAKRLLSTRRYGAYCGAAFKNCAVTSSIAAVTASQKLKL